jgi:hypothetical protein
MPSLTIALLKDAGLKTLILKILSWKDATNLVKNTHKKMGMLWHTHFFCILVAVT